ncbi:MAG: TadE/TadG family type IV pilus assembly protein [Pseudomonadota bacterium]
MMRAISKALRTIRGNTRGGSSVEFAVAFPFLCMFLFGYGEFGTLATRAVMLERGLDIAIREVRLGNIPTDLGNVSAEEAADFQRELIKFRICQNAFLLVDCRQDLNVELIAIPLGDPIPTNEISCVDRAAEEINPPAQMNFGTAGAADLEVMLVRACLVVDPIFEIGGWLAGVQITDPDTGEVVDHAIFAQTAFAREPAPTVGN